MGSRFFGYLSIVVGVFVCLAGGCILLLGAGFEAMFGIIVGLVLIVVGSQMVGDRKKSHDD